MYRLGSLLVIAIVSLIAAAPAGAVLPPGNSAANQYTEAYPTGGGNQPTDRGGRQSPAQALGKENVRKLQGMGPEGAAAAQLAGETAPASGGNGADGKTRAGGSGGGAGEGGVDAAAAEGSSGLRQVIGSATGSSESGELGLMLPLVILATLALSGLYAWRRRNTA